MFLGRPAGCRDGNEFERRRLKAGNPLRRQLWSPGEIRGPGMKRENLALVRGGSHGSNVWPHGGGRCGRTWLLPWLEGRTAIRNPRRRVGLGVYE